MKAEAIVDIVKGVTNKWAKQRKAEERNASVYLRRRDAMTRAARVTIKEAAWQVMEAAYNKVSSNGTLPANARQIMYAARPQILELTGRTELDDQYFTQTLLPDYVEENGVDWDVIYDARGRITEPHNEGEVQLGTLQVRQYLDVIAKHQIRTLSFSICEALYPTRGPTDRYGAILFIEKEGFAPLFRAVKLADRYDIAIMSTKGQSVTACRELVQAMSLLYNLPVYVLHDFDVSGFSIFGTLSKSTRRFKYDQPVRVIDLGLRLNDIDGLEAEQVSIDHKSKESKRATLRKHGATDDEIEFLVPRSGMGERVELNALTSEKFIAWIERRLDEHGVTKLIPDEDKLVDAYRRIRKQAIVQPEINKLVAKLDTGEGDLVIPDGLKDRIRERLEGPDRTQSWDQVLWTIVNDDIDKG